MDRVEIAGLNYCIYPLDKLPLAFLWFSSVKHGLETAMGKYVGAYIRDQV